MALCMISYNFQISMAFFQTTDQRRGDEWHETFTHALEEDSEIFTVHS